MGKPTSLPAQALDHAADQALAHLPTEIPPAGGGSGHEVTLPVEHMSPLGVAHLPDWLT
jgi:hypothetical protein